METCKSPRRVLKDAYELARPLLPPYASRFSRKDFTEAQLFACLVLREHQKKSYRGVEALLNDCPAWLEDIGLSRTPDHNTLCRAFGRLVKRGLMSRMLDEQARQAGRLKLIKGRIRPVALDSSMFESRHVSRHFEKRCRQTERKNKTQKKTANPGRMPRR